MQRPLEFLTYTAKPKRGVLIRKQIFETSQWTVEQRWDFREDSGHLEREIISGLPVKHRNIQNSKRIIKDKYLIATQRAGISW